MKLIEPPVFLKKSWEESITCLSCSGTFVVEESDLTVADGSDIVHFTCPWCEQRFTRAKLPTFVVERLRNRANVGN